METLQILQDILFNCYQSSCKLTWTVLSRPKCSSCSCALRHTMIGLLFVLVLVSLAEDDVGDGVIGIPAREGSSETQKHQGDETNGELMSALGVDTEVQRCHWLSIRLIDPILTLIKVTSRSSVQGLVMFRQSKVKTTRHKKLKRSLICVFHAWLIQTDLSENHFIVSWQRYSVVEKEIFAVTLVLDFLHKQEPQTQTFLAYLAFSFFVACVFFLSRVLGFRRLWGKSDFIMFELQLWAFSQRRGVIPGRPTWTLPTGGLKVCGAHTHIHPYSHSHTLSASARTCRLSHTQPPHRDPPL